ncbi:MAG: c-type cytochrome [Bacteriovoracaceae bacterium]|nr:c-type cytochrome [Bacteriovoracaceae bacterium]
MAQILALIFIFNLHFTSVVLAAGDVKNGENLFKKCISCHGADGMGKKSQNAPMIAGQYDWYVVSQVMAIKNKVRDNANTKKMYPFVKGLSQSEIEDLAAYITQLPVKK